VEIVGKTRVIDFNHLDYTSGHWTHG